MQRKKVTILCQGVAACALWICGLPMLRSQPPAPADTSQETQTEKRSKPRKSRKSTADAASSQAAGPAEASQKKPHAPAPVKTASEAEIQSAKASGQVWVNTDSGVYHKGGKWFGATKQGKFMSEQDAVKAGYRAAKNEK
jgi:hypothetical protein